MTKIYILVFSNNLGSIETVKNCINAMPDLIMAWRYDMSNAIYFTSNKSADELSKAFKSRINNNGRFIILEITNNKQGWLPEDTWYFLDNKTLKKNN